MTDATGIWLDEFTDDMMLKLSELKPCTRCEHCDGHGLCDRGTIPLLCSDERRERPWWDIRDWFTDRCQPYGRHFTLPNPKGMVTFRRPSPFTMPEVHP